MRTVPVKANFSASSANVEWNTYVFNVSAKAVSLLSSCCKQWILVRHGRLNCVQCARVPFPDLDRVKYDWTDVQDLFTRLLVRDGAANELEASLHAYELREELHSFAPPPARRRAPMAKPLLMGQDWNTPLGYR